MKIFIDTVQELEYRVDGGHFCVVIPHATLDKIGEIVYLEPPEIGRKYKKGEEFATVETVKKCFFLEMPCDGEALLPTFDGAIATFEGEFKQNENCVEVC